MSIVAGFRLGPYEIKSLLGAGGMGEVYRASDLHLKREVAIKMLPAALTADVERLARLQREAELLAALNHPNVAQVFGLEMADGVRGLAMELVEGPTLADRIAQGPLALDEAIRIATQIADALEAAHERGIVHRDLKPANVKVRRDGTVKVLDFGLAKSIDRGTSVAAATTIPNAPTTVSPARITEHGLILGTATYMAPEQARGEEVGRAADIWAFGCVLFEMLAGTPPFRGSSVGELIAELLKSEPEWKALPASTPDHVRRLLRRCLIKDPRRRLQHFGDARLELADDAQNAQPPQVAARTTWRVWLPWVVSGATVLAALAVIPLSPNGATSAGPVVRLELNLPPQVEASTIAAPGAAVSPDGAKVVFTGHEGGLRRLYIRDLDSTAARALPSTETASQCYFSPDGSAVIYIASDRTLRRVSLSDGLNIVLARGVDRNFGAGWGSDGLVTFVAGGTLHQLPHSGGEPRQIATLDRTKGELFHGWPSNVPGTSIVLFTVVSGGTRDAHRIDMVDPRSGERREVVPTGSFPMLAADGPLVFMRDGALVAAPFDRTRLVLTGPPVKVADDVALDALGVPLASLSQSGALIYLSQSSRARRLTTVARSGLAVPFGEARAYDYPRLSPDGLRVTTFVAGDIWQHDIARSAMSRVTSEAAVGNSYAVWLPDGKRIVFRTATGLRIGAADGGGVSAPISGTSVADFPNAVTPDGKSLVFTRQTVDTSADVYALSLEGDPHPRKVIGTPAYEGGGVVSPNGRWLAYGSNEAERFDVYVVPFVGEGPRLSASSDGGTQPMWSRDGKELYYRQGPRMFAVSVVERQGLTLGNPQLLFERTFSYGTGLTFAEYDVMPDGRFVMAEQGSESARLNVILNWTAELKRLIEAR